MWEWCITDFIIGFFSILVWMNNTILHSFVDVFAKSIFVEKIGLTNFKFVMIKVKRNAGAPIAEDHFPKRSSTIISIN
jgi:hypothetical protein